VTSQCHTPCFAEERLLPQIRYTPFFPRWRLPLQVSEEGGLSLFVEFVGGGDVAHLLQKAGGRFPESVVSCYTRWVMAPYGSLGSLGVRVAVGR